MWAACFSAIPTNHLVAGSRHHQVARRLRAPPVCLGANRVPQCLGPSVLPAGQEGKAKHAKAKHDTSYKEMAIYALQQVGSAFCSLRLGGGLCWPMPVATQQACSFVSLAPCKHTLLGTRFSTLPPAPTLPPFPLFPLLRVAQLAHSTGVPTGQIRAATPARLLPNTCCPGSPSPCAAGAQDGRPRGHQRPDLCGDSAEPGVPAAAGHCHCQRQEDAAAVSGLGGWGWVAEWGLWMGGRCG